MRVQDFEFFAPENLKEVTELLVKNEGEIKILAGGQSLIPLLKTRIMGMPMLISLDRVPHLSYIRETETGVSIGSMTRVSDLEDSRLIKDAFPALHDAAVQIADPLIRNSGTVGGNISHADPGNDLPAVMLSLGATFKVVGPDGEREIKAEDFFVDTYTTSLEPTEILTEIAIPSSRPYGSYVKFKKSAGDFSVAAVAVSIELGAQEKVESMGIALTSVGPTPIKVKEAEEYARGRALDENTITGIAEMSAAAADPVSDFYGTAEFKRKIVGMIVPEAIRKALRR